MATVKRFASGETTRGVAMSLWEPAQFTFVLAYRNALIPVKPGYQALSRTWLPGRVRNGPIGRQRKRTDHPTSICADDFSLRRVRRFIPTTFPNPLMCMARTNAELSEWAAELCGEAGFF